MLFVDVPAVCRSWRSHKLQLRGSDILTQRNVGTFCTQGSRKHSFDLMLSTEKLAQLYVKSSACSCSRTFRDVLILASVMVFAYRFASTAQWISALSRFILANEASYGNYHWREAVSTANTGNFDSQAVGFRPYFSVRNLDRLPFPCNITSR